MICHHPRRQLNDGRERAQYPERQGKAKHVCHEPDAGGPMSIPASGCRDDRDRNACWHHFLLPARRHSTGTTFEIPNPISRNPAIAVNATGRPHSQEACHDGRVPSINVARSPIRATTASPLKRPALITIEKSIQTMPRASPREDLVQREAKTLQSSIAPSTRKVMDRAQL